MAQHFIVRAILRAVRALPNDPHLRVLDLSCGRGEILASLHADGCIVRGTHYRGDDFEIQSGKQLFLAPEIAVDTGVDLTSPLPYEDGSFEVVLLSEVVEHLPRWIGVLHESGRVLAPGGHLVLSTPNVQRLHSRWKFFWTGTHKLIRERPGRDVAPDQLYASTSIRATSRSLTRCCIKHRCASFSFASRASKRSTRGCFSSTR